MIIKYQKANDTLPHITLYYKTTIIMKSFILTFLLTLSTCSLSATEVFFYNNNTSTTQSTSVNIEEKSKGLKPGYRGFIDGTFLVGNDNVYRNFNVKGGGFSTGHGYQFSPYIFLGGGFAFYYYDFVNYDSGKSVPFYADFRVNMMDKNISPFFDLRIGYSPSNSMQGVFFSPTLGVRFGITENFALNFSLAYTMQGYETYERYRYYSSYEKQFAHCLNVSLGIDF